MLDGLMQNPQQRRHSRAAGRTRDQMATSSSTATTVAALLVTGCALAYGASTVFSTKSVPSLDDLDDVEENPDECITPELVVDVFDKLFMQMQQVVLQLSQQVQQLQMAGQSIPEKQLRQLLKGEFERALLAFQPKVYEDNDVDADCLEEATWEFLSTPDDYPKVKRAVERFQNLYQSISGEEVVGWTPSKGKSVASGRELSADELMKAAKLYFETITETMIDIAKAHKEAGKDLKSQEFQMEAATRSNEAAEDKIKKEMDISIGEFRSAVEKHQRNPIVGQTLGMLQMKQQQELMAAGLPLM